MPPQPQLTGVCVLRVEVQRTHILITITEDRDVGLDASHAASSTSRHFIDADDAVVAVRDFLKAFVPDCTN